MLKPRSPPLQVAPQDRRVLDLELARDIAQHRFRNCGRIGQEHTQPPRRRQLQSEPKPVVLPATLLDQLAVGVVEEEDTIELGA
jgi:hypothetical protein